VNLINAEAVSAEIAEGKREQSAYLLVLVRHGIIGG
jgi:hypothetical protein